MKLWTLTPQRFGLIKLSNLPVIGQVRTYRIQSQHRVLTLDPTNLVQLKQSAIDISGHWMRTLALPTGLSQIYFMTVYSPDRPLYRERFPAKTRGFFYYHSPSDRPRISGQLRFRITPSDDPASFPYGHDLHTLRTTRRLPKPWNVPLVRMPAVRQYDNLLSALVREGLVEDSLVQCIRGRKSHFGP
ncbi:hypothetical protein BJ165DRAFT_1592524 [Panaeolus papilionaceus]|nr:hypothetical protein BJ165DRAFT_1592524 [Panaeolus papilionaceus]